MGERATFPGLQHSITAIMIDTARTWTHCGGVIFRCYGPFPVFLVLEVLITSYSPNTGILIECAWRKVIPNTTSIRTVGLLKPLLAIFKLFSGFPSNCNALTESPGDFLRLAYDQLWCIGSKTTTPNTQYVPTQLYRNTGGRL